MAIQHLSYLTREYGVTTDECGICCATEDDEDDDPWWA